MELEWLSKHIGLRVQAHPATDAWITGDRYGEVTKVGRTLVHVRMDRSGKVRKFRPDDLEEAIV